MGSFNDTYYADHANLFGAVEDVLRDSRCKMGRPCFEVPRSELLSPGQHVRLIKGETISLGRDESVQKAPQSNLVYEVVAQISNDIDNMPRYYIKADSHVWFARHNALAAA